MEVLIKGKLTNLTPERIEALHPTFSLLHGRQFNLQDDCGKVSLNNLISAVKDAALKNKQNLSEVEEILRVFKAIENKGYDFSNNDISQENFLIRTITKIKHFFSKKPRELLLKEIKQILSNHPNTSQQTQNIKSSGPVHLNKKDPVKDLQFSQNTKKNLMAMTRVLLGTRFKEGTPISCSLQEILIAAADRLSNEPNKEQILGDIERRIKTEDFQINPQKYVEGFIKKTVPPKTHVDAILLDFFCALIRDRDTNPDFPWNK